MDRYPFAFEDRFRPLLKLLGIRPDNSGIVVTDEELFVRFGLFSLRTPRSNVVGTERSGGYRWFKAIGPRASLADGGLTFGTNTDAGLCVRFSEPVPALFGRFRPHPAMTVTPADVDGLEAALHQHPATPDAG